MGHNYDRTAGDAISSLPAKPDAADWGTFFEEFASESDFELADGAARNASTYVKLAQERCSDADQSLRRSSGGKIGLPSDELNAWVAQELDHMHGALDTAEDKLKEALKQVTALRKTIISAKSKAK